MSRMCGAEFRYPHTWVAMEKHGLVIPVQVRTMLEQRDRDLEDFVTALAECCCGGGDVDGCEFSGTGLLGGEAPALSGYSLTSVAGNTTVSGGTPNFINLGDITPGNTHWVVTAVCEWFSDDTGKPPDVDWVLADSELNTIHTETLEWTGSTNDWRLDGYLSSGVSGLGDESSVTLLSSIPGPDVTIDGYCIGSL